MILKCGGSIVANQSACWGSSPGFESWVSPKVYCIQYISDRRDNIPLRLPNMCLTQPLPPLALSDSQVVGVVYSMYTADRAGRGWVRHVWKTQRDAVRSITNIHIHILWYHLTSCRPRISPLIYLMIISYIPDN